MWWELPVCVKRGWKGLSDLLTPHFGISPSINTLLTPQKEQEQNIFKLGLLDESKALSGDLKPRNPKFSVCEYGDIYIYPNPVVCYLKKPHSYLSLVFLVCFVLFCSNLLNFLNIWQMSVTVEGRGKEMEQEEGNKLGMGRGGESQKYFPCKFPYRGNGNENLLHARHWVRHTRHHARWTSKREQRNTTAWQPHWLKNPFAQAWESLLSPREALAWPEENIKDTPDFKSLPRAWSAGQEMGKSSWKEPGREGA